MVIYYHGTSLKNALSICREGFREYTYFATHLEDAVGYGGSYVFHVMFEKRMELDVWQFREPGVVPVDRIVRLRHHEVVELFSNSVLSKRIFDKAIAEYENDCQVHSKTLDKPH